MISIRGHLRTHFSAKTLLAYKPATTVPPLPSRWAHSWTHGLSSGGKGKVAERRIRLLAPAIDGTAGDDAKTNSTEALAPTAFGSSQQRQRSPTQQLAPSSLPSRRRPKPYHGIGSPTLLTVRYYVRELPWSSRSPSIKKFADPAECRPCQKGKIVAVSNSEVTPSPERFGIVAAMSRNRVIGVGGALPWVIPEDRRRFEDLTRNKVLIIGRHSFYEQEDGTHISHVRRCIVVSTTANPSDYPDDIVIARSFPGALGIAKELADSDGEMNDIDCWVGGGERLYEEALTHPGAFQLHLTKVDTNVDVVKLRDSASDGAPVSIAMFPAKYRWDNKFKEVKRWDGEEAGSTASSGHKYTFFVYERR